MDPNAQVQVANSQGDVANNEAPQQQPNRIGQIISFAKSIVIRIFIIYAISSFFKRPTTNDNVDPKNSVPKIAAANLFENGSIFDLYNFLSENERLTNFEDKNLLLWKQPDLVYGDWYSGPNGDGTYNGHIKFKPSQQLTNNGSIYLHTYVVKKNFWRGNNVPLKEIMTSRNTIYSSKRLNKFKKRSFTNTQNLLTGETAASPEEVLKAKTIKSEIVSHWHPNLTINLLTEQVTWTPGSVPPPMDEYIEFLPEAHLYKPPLFFNDYWNMRRDYKPINDTVKELEIYLTYQPISVFKWQLYLAQSNQAKWMTMYSSGGESDEQDSDQDSLKEMLLETSPYLVAATVIVSILHSVFELLAFKNDIQFWNNRQSLEGLSVRLVMFNVFQTAVVFLFVLDNDANFMLIVSCFIGLIIELWKINKVLDFTLHWDNKILGLFPKVTVKDKGSYVESSTKEYDQLAFRYLSWLLYPLLGGYAIYSLLYEEHKGWYSWVLNMLYGFLLTFGFIMMTPQLFINYKLKSVAHLPWRMMTYKCLNTFIDDIFAFVIKMPTLYRIGCLRDDVVFFIFLYQKWIYKTDLSRINEFGVSGEMEGEKKLSAPEEEVAAIEDKKQN